MSTGVRLRVDQLADLFMENFGFCNSLITAVSYEHAKGPLSPISDRCH